MLFKKAFWMTKGKPFQSILSIVLMVIVALSLFVGMLFNKTAAFVKSGGTFYYPIAISAKDPDVHLSLDFIEKLAKDPMISGFNSSTVQSVKPVDFRNWVGYYQKTDNISSDAELSIDLDVKFSDAFVNNTAKLIEGEFPTKNNHGVIVEKTMAKYNDIHIGDTIKIDIDHGNKKSRLSLKVLGFYQLKVPLEVKDQINNRSIYVVSPNTRLFTNVYSVDSTYITINKVNFYTSKEENIPLILKELKKKIDSTFDIRNETDLPLVLLNKSVDELNEYLNWIIFTLLLASCVMLILFFVYTQHKNSYELAIPYILGTSKKHIILLNLIQVCYQMIFANIISAVLIIIYSEPLGLYWISQVTKGYQDHLISYSFQSERAALMDHYNPNDIGILLIALAVVSLISILVSILYSAFFLRLNSQKIIGKIN